MGLQSLIGPSVSTQERGRGEVLVFRRGDVDVMFVKSSVLGWLYSDVFDKRMSIRVEAGLRSITK